MLGFEYVHKCKLGTIRVSEGTRGCYVPQPWADMLSTVEQATLPWILCAVSVIFSNLSPPRLLWCGPACPSFWTWCRSGVHSFWCARYSSFPRHTVVYISYTLSSRPNFSICMWCVWSRIVDWKSSFGINCLLLFASSTCSVCYYSWCFQCLLRWGRELVWPDSNEPGGLSGSFQKKYKYIPCGTKTSSNKNSSRCVWSKKDGMRIFPQKVSA